MSYDSPHHQLMVKTRIAVLMRNINSNPAIGQRVMAHDLREDESVDTVVARDMVLRFNPAFVRAEGQTPAGRERLVELVTAVAGGGE